MSNSSNATFTVSHDGFSFPVTVGAITDRPAVRDLRFVAQGELVAMGTYEAFLEIQSRIDYINSPAFAAGIIESNKTRPRAKRLSVEVARAQALANC